MQTETRDKIKIETGDKIRIFENTQTDSYITLFRELGYNSHVQGKYIVIGKPYRQSTNYGKQIKEARLKKGLTREEVAKIMGVTVNCVYCWEWGRTRPRDWKKLQKELDI